MRLLLPNAAAAFAFFAVPNEAFTFAPSGLVGLARPSSTARSLGVDPSHLTDVFHQIDTAFASSSTSMMLSDAMDAVADAAASSGMSIDEAGAEIVKDNGGWFGFLTGPIEGLLQIIHSAIASTGVANSWGISIIALTVLIKVVTFPLTKTQLEGTNKMQAMQPAIKEIQAKYQSNPEVMNQKVAEFYQTNDINPLAGCLPSLVQIPVFIGLYRAVLALAKENKMDESFFFLPSLEGPTYGADPATASDWILKGWVDGTPTLGWHDTTTFLILPVFLVISQFVSMELMQPKTQDPAAAQTNVILKFLPLMIGWFSLSVPAALSVYWVTNNIITTSSSLWIRNSMKLDPPKTGGDGASAATMAAPAQTIFSPPREKPSGFGASAPVNEDGVKLLTSIDAEIVEDEEESAPKKKKRKGSKKKN